MNKYKVKKEEFFYPSKDLNNKIHGICWIPEGEIKAVLQILHGMCEHIDRYHDFACFLAEQGICVVGNDHLGHGKSVKDQKWLGYFGEPDGNAWVIGDIHSLREKMQKKYENVPYFMLGHSMGSFLLRQYLGRYSEGLSGAVVMGTGNQPGPVLAAGKMVCRLQAAFKGWEYRSKLINGFAIGAYEKKLGAGWISANEENLKKYAKDPLCGFIFTLNGFYHMFDGMSKMNAAENAGKIPKKMPVLFVAGEEDPVGDYGKGVRTVYEKYVKKGAKQAAIKLYPKDRHEILNEDDRQQVYEDLYAWMESKI